MNNTNDGADVGDWFSLPILPQPPRPRIQPLTYLINTFSIVGLVYQGGIASGEAPFARPIRGRVLTRSAFTLLARIVDTYGNYLTAANVRSAYYLVTNISLGHTPVVVIDQTPTPLAMLVGLDNFKPWLKDSIGYNFRFDVPANFIAVNNFAYQFEFWWTQVDGKRFPVVFQVGDGYLYGP